MKTDDKPIESAIHTAAKRYLDPSTPQDEKNRLRHKLDPWITIEDGKEKLNVPGLEWTK